jgi:hypothetical protein
LEFKHQRVTKQPHYTAAQSSLSAGALATLCGVASEGAASASVVESIHSTTQVRPFGNDDGKQIYIHNLTYPRTQTTTLTKNKHLSYLSLYDVNCPFSQNGITLK